MERAVAEGASGVGRVSPMSAAEAITLASAPAAPHHQRAVAAAVAFMAVLFALAVPFAKRPLGEFAPFLPLFQSALITCEAITGVLLLGQFRTQRSVALLILAAGYFFSAFMAVAHLLSFPGVFAPTGLLGAGTQTTAWLYFFWHGGFPLFVLGYCAARSRDRAMIRGDKLPAAWLAPVMLAGVMTLVVALTVLGTVFEASLPVIRAGNSEAPAKVVVAHASWLLSALAGLALVGLMWRRGQSLLDLWLIVVVCAWLFDVGLAAALNHARFDLGWYAGRVFGLAAALLVLVKLLLENSALHRQVLALRDRERRTASEQLRDSERRFEAIFEQAPVGIAHVSRDGHWLRVNAHLCEILGYQAEDLKRRTFLDLVHRDDAAATEARRLRLLAGEIGPEAEERRHVRGDGQVVLLRITGAIVRDAAGAPDSFIAVVQDLTEQRQAEDKVHALSQEMVRLSQLEVAVQTVTALAHELNQPLSVVSATATAARQMLQSGHWSEARLGEMLDEAGAAALRAGRMLRDMMSFNNQGRMSCDPIDLNGLVIELVARFHHNHPAEDDAIRFDLQAGIPAVLANRLRIEKVLTNLLDNGIEAILDGDAGRDACLTVSTRIDGDRARLSVADNGPGLDPPTAARVFDPFFTTKSSGLGMGLAVSRAIADSHGGRLWAESPPDGGAVFHLTLPFAR